MKIMLISPPFYRFLGSVSNDVRLSLGYLSAVLRKLGHEVAQYNPDCGTEYSTQKELFDNTDRFAKDIVKPHHPVYQECYKVIDDYAPDIVGMTVLSGNVIQTEILAKYCHDNNIHTWVGGPMVTLALDKMLEYPYFDQLVPGEAESVLKRVVNNKSQRVIVGIPVGNLDLLPFPDRDNFIGPLSEQINRSGIISSRGCPMQCKYCAHWILSGEIRYRSTKNVIDELSLLKEKYGQQFFRFFDDNFLTNRQRVIDLCAQIMKKELNIEFLIETRVHGIDQPIVDILKHSGMRKIKLGIESGSQQMLKEYKQGLRIEVIKETVSLLKKSGIQVHANWLYGFPSETNEDLQATINLARELECDWNTISNLSPYYGSEMFELLSDEDRKSWRYFYHNRKEPIINKSLSMDLIEELLSINGETKKFSQINK